jgi:hypothetical protein
VRMAVGLSLLGVGVKGYGRQLSYRRLFGIDWRSQSRVQREDHLQNETIWRTGVKLRGRRSELQGFIAFGREQVPQGRFEPPCAHRVRYHDGFDMGFAPDLPIIETLLVRDYLLTFSTIPSIPRKLHPQNLFLSLVHRRLRNWRSQYDASPMYGIGNGASLSKCPTSLVLGAKRKQKLFLLGSGSAAISAIEGLSNISSLTYIAG